jgi:hypothetical protein
MTLWSLLLLTTLSANPTPKEVESLIRQGQAQYQKGHYAEAAATLQKAYEKQPLARLLYNIARAFEKAGDIDQAVNYYQQYVDAQGTEVELMRKASHAIVDLRAQQAKAAAKANAAAANSNTTSTQDNTTASGSSSGNSTSDNSKTSNASDANSMNPAGAHPAADKTDKTDKTGTELAKADPSNSKSVVTTSPKSDSDAKSTQPPPAEPSHLGANLLIGTGVVGLLASGGLGFWTVQTVNAEKPSTDPVKKPLLRQQAFDRATATDVALGVGVVALSVGIVWRIVSHSSSSSPSENSPAVPHVSVSPNAVSAVWSLP